MFTMMASLARAKSGFESEEQRRDCAISKTVLGHIDYWRSRDRVTADRRRLFVAVPGDSVALELQGKGKKHTGRGVRIIKRREGKTQKREQERTHVWE